MPAKKNSKTTKKASSTKAVKKSPKKKVTVKAKTSTKKIAVKKVAVKKAVIKKTAAKKPKSAVKHHLSPMQRELRKDDFRVAIFGSARTQKDDKDYIQVFELAKMIGAENWDVVTGGGPGLMEAANAGHAAGDPKHNSDNIGLVIKLPWEAGGNKHLEIKKKFNKFSNRLDTFMALSSAVIVMPGGVGTCLELFYTWQLVQVQHIHPVPIILVGKMWKKLMKWVQRYPLKAGLISPHETKCIHIAKNNEEAMKIIKQNYKGFLKNGNHNNKDYLKT